MKALMLQATKMLAFGAVDQALRLCEQAEQLSGSSAALSLLRARAYLAQGALAQAQETLFTITTPSLELWQRWGDLALALQGQGHRAEASGAFAQAAHWGAEAWPTPADEGFLQEWLRLTTAHVFCLIDLQARDQARAVLQAAFHRLGAVAQQPFCAPLWQAQGFLALRSDAPIRAQESFRQTLLLMDQGQSPVQDRAAVLAGLGAALFDAGERAEARAVLDEAVRLDPNAPEPRMNRAAVLLAQGNPETRDTADWQQGWLDLEYRWQTVTFRRRYRAAQAPAWDGSAVADGTLLVRCEQAFGDALMLARLLPLLVQRFQGQVILETLPSLCRLFAALPLVQAGAVRVVPFDKGVDWPPHQVQVGMMSLPRLLLKAPGAVPPAACFDAAQRAAIGQKAGGLGKGRGPAIGLCWGGRAQPRDRSVDLPTLWLHLQAASADKPVRWVCLQADERRDDAPPEVWVPPAPQDFAESAALVAQLDLVISVDSAVLHLAGMLGTPLVGLLLHGPCWRYGPDAAAGDSASPWYPTAALFRQSALQDWSGALMGLERWLADWLRGR